MRDLDLFLEVERHDHERGPVVRRQTREQFEDRTVLVGVGKRRPERLDKARERGGRVRRVVLTISIGLKIEGILVLRILGAHQQGVPVAQAVPDTELIEYVGVVDGEVGDHQIGEHQQPEHILPDVALPRDLERRAAFNSGRRERRSDKLPLHLIEIDAALRAEGTNDKSAGDSHDSTSLDLD
ncbi:hypothetical protein ACU4GH_23600 [Bradyrhizobium betae]